MKIGVLYSHVVGRAPGAPPSDHYQAYARRFFRTYAEFAPTVHHDLVVIACGGKPDPAVADMFPNARNESYTGGGWDVGAWQQVARSSDYDLVVCFSAHGYFWRRGWLERIAWAVREHGIGLYGVHGSFENTPHLRTSGLCFAPELMRRYGWTVHDRGDTYRFESLQWNFTTWAGDQGYPVKLVTWDGVYDEKDWRRPPDIFRRGDQSNCLTWDRHTDWFMGGGFDERTRLAGLSDQPWKRVNWETGKTGES